MNNPQFRNIVQQYLTAYIAPRTRTDGGFAGNTPPPTPQDFRERLNQEAANFHFNSWDLDSLEAITLLDQASTIYMNAYGQWSMHPLAGDAPSAVVDWQKGVRG